MSLRLIEAVLLLLVLIGVGVVHFSRPHAPPGEKRSGE